MKYKMDKRSTCYRKFDVCVWMKIALCCVVWTYLINLAYSGCAYSSIPETQVAYMCIDSEASGQTVYIDTTKAKATDNSSGPLCICDATISNAKFVNVSVQENIATCGSKLKFDFTNKQVESDENKCRSIEEFVQIENQQEVRLSLEKIKTPYSVDFCTKIEIVLGQEVLDTSTKAQRTDPIISIECYESTRFSTTSTTTSTTTTTTTTITPHEETNKDEDILTTLKKPYVIAGMVVGALVLITVTTGLVIAVRQKKKNSDSEDIINDMWISGKDSGKELEPLNM